jgi:hypothetical protein
MQSHLGLCGLPAQARKNKIAMPPDQPEIKVDISTSRVRDATASLAARGPTKKMRERTNQ